MIVFFYQCEKCSHHFHTLYSKDDSEHLYCPSCGSTDVATKQDQSLSDYINSCLENNSIS